VGAYCRRVPGRGRARSRTAPGSRWERWSSPGPGEEEPVEVLLAGESDARFHLHWHETWSLGAILEGACAFSCDGRRAVARAGSLVLIPPFSVHTAGTSSLRFRMVMLYLPAEAVARRLGTEPGALPVLSRNVWRRPAAARALAAAAAERRLEVVWSVLAQAVLRCRAVPAADRPSGPVDPRIARISSLLRVTEGMPDLAALARRVGLSREHLHRLFRATLGLTPGQYLRLTRMVVARRLLRRGDRIADAALACGFADQAHFSRWFRRYLGVTPRAFVAAGAGSR
jgi:AraC-like DNA-binding protein